MSFARMRALAVVGGLVALTLIFVTIALLRDRQSGSAQAQGCAANAIVADLRLPLPEEIKVRVTNGTDKADLDKGVAEAFRNRKFQVIDPAPGTKPKRVSSVVVLRYGPKAVGAAWLVRTYFLNQGEREFDINRTDDVVDVVVGTGYKQLASPTETKQALGQAGSPILPEGTCAKP